MRVSLARSGIAWQHALLGVVLVVALSACHVYERPGPGYYDAAVAVAPPPPQVVVEPQEARLRAARFKLHISEPTLYFGVIETLDFGRRWRFQSRPSRKVALRVVKTDSHVARPKHASENQ
jgi:hypothetical protein